MKKIKAKWAALLAALSCFAVCLGVGAAKIVPSETSTVTVSAETQYTINDLTVHLHSTAGNANANNTTLWVSGTGDTSDAWAYYTCESGTGVKLNGETAANIQVQDFSGGLYLKNFTVNVGDLITIGGTFVNEAGTTKYVISKDNYFRWNGAAWVKCYEPFNVGKLAVKSGDASSVYFKPADANVTLPIDSWTDPFSYVSGNGITVNGTMISMENSVKSPSGDFYVGLGQTVSTGAVLKIGGVLSCKAHEKDYVIEDSAFQWDGTEWVEYVEYEEYTLSKLQVANTSKAGGAYVGNYRLSLTMEGGATVSDWPWFVYESGVGFQVNGESASLTGGIPNAVQDTSGGLYFVFAGVNAGDYITIGGTFTNDDLKYRYTIPESKFQWNGTEWVDYVEYDTQNIGALALHSNGGTATTLYLQRADGEALPVLDWDHVFTYESGDGWKVNGVSKALSEMKSTNDGLYLKFEAVPTNATVSISGTFVYSQKPVKYVITESKFVWTGTEWEPYIEYIEYNVGNLTVNALSAPNGGAVANDFIYLLKEDGSIVDDWTYYTYVSGDGFKVNGESKSLTAIQNVGSGLYLAFSGVNKGDVISISGTYKCVATGLKYVIDEAHFTWTGAGWLKCYADGQLAAYDVVSISDLGYGVEKTINTTVAIDNTGLSYTASTNNTTGSVKFRFGFNATDIAALTEIRLRGTAWQGIRFIIGDSQIKSWYSSTVTTYALSANTDYVIELGAIDLLDGDNIWIYAKVDGVMFVSDLVAKTDTNPNEDGTPTFGTFTTNNVSCYFNAGVNVTFTDLDHVAINYVTESLEKTVVYYADKNSGEYTLLGGKSYMTFIGWVVNGELYFAGDTIEIGEDNITATALEIDFRVQDGAAIRVAGNAEESGIRFTTLLKETDLEKLNSYVESVESVSYGTLIIPYDYLAFRQLPNLTDFDINENLTDKKEILKIASTYSEVNSDGYVVYRGAMRNLYEENYERLFAGRGYMEITLKNGETITVYTPFNEQDNIRSIRQISQAFMADESEPAEGEIRYATLGDTQKGIVDTYAAVDTIDLMDYASYAANNFLNVIAWNYPALDESNEYNNEKNIAIATQMKNTGIRVVNLTGLNLLTFDSKENIEKTRQIINFFWSQGLQTVAFAANNFENVNYDFTEIGTPDFSDCEGFIGFLHWDEPTENDTIMSKLADLAIQFNDVYAGTDVTYMNNLLPSYASYFQTESSSWFGSSTTLDKAAYKAYVEEYCTKVLSQVQGQKWLSVDSYPINADKTLHDTFLFDLGVIKYYAMQNDAHAHVALQSSGFENSDDDSKNRIPTEAEMRMQAYAAMAFGMDSISWFTYSPSGSDTETFYTFVDNDGNITDQDAYDAFTAVNTELAAIGAVYSAFDWKGVILGAGTDNTTKTIIGTVKDADDDYNAFATVMGQIGDYQLNVGDTKHLSSVVTNKTDWNYLMGVMQDANGNEGYVLCNYNNHEADRAQTITITFNKNVTEVLIYGKNWLVDGKPKAVSVTNKTLTVSLATGEGVIILPSQLG